MIQRSENAIQSYETKIDTEKEHIKEQQTNLKERSEGIATLEAKIELYEHYDQEKNELADRAIALDKAKKELADSQIALETALKRRLADIHQDGANKRQRTK